MGILPTKPYNRGKAARKLHLFRRLTAPLPPWRQLLASPLAGIPIFCEDVPFKTIQPRPCRVELQFSSSNGAASRCVGNFRLARLPIFSFDAQLVHRDCHALGFPTGELATESTEEVQFCERQRGLRVLPHFSCHFPQYTLISLGLYSLPLFYGGYVQYLKILWYCFGTFWRAWGFSFDGIECR